MNLQTIRALVVVELKKLYRDPMTLGVLGLVLAAVACLAALVPARRASRVDPMRALRWE